MLYSFFIIKRIWINEWMKEWLNPELSVHLSDCNFVVQRLLLGLGVLSSQLRCYIHSIVCHAFDMPLIKRILIEWLIHLIDIKEPNVVVTRRIFRARSVPRCVFGSGGYLYRAKKKQNCCDQPRFLGSKLSNCLCFSIHPYSCKRFRLTNRNESTWS